MPDSAIEVARHLLEFGLTSGEWADEFVRLLMNLGPGGGGVRNPGAARAARS